MGLGYGERVDEMALYKIHAVEGNYTEPDSNVVPTEILWAYKELLVSSYAEERSPLATRRDVVVWNLRCTPGECGVMGKKPPPGGSDYLWSDPNLPRRSSENMSI